MDKFTTPAELATMIMATAAHPMVLNAADLGHWSTAACQPGNYDLDSAAGEINDYFTQLLNTSRLTYKQAERIMWKEHAHHIWRVLDWHRKDVATHEYMAA